MCWLIKLAEHILLDSQYNLYAIHLASFLANLRNKEIEADEQPLQGYYSLVVHTAACILETWAWKNKFLIIYCEIGHCNAFSNVMWSLSFIFSFALYVENWASSLLHHLLALHLQTMHQLDNTDFTAIMLQYIYWYFTPFFKLICAIYTTCGCLANLVVNILPALSDWHVCYQLKWMWQKSSRVLVESNSTLSSIFVKNVPFSLLDLPFWHGSKFLAPQHYLY